CRPSRFFGRGRLLKNNRVIGLFLENARSNLPALIAVDACLVHEEITGDVFGVGAIEIGHKESLTLLMRRVLAYSKASVFATRRRWRSSVRSVDSQVRTISRIRSFEIIFPPSVRTLAPLCSRLLRADASS